MKLAWLLWTNRSDRQFGGWALLELRLRVYRLLAKHPDITTRDGWFSREHLRRDLELVLIPDDNAHALIALHQLAPKLVFEQMPAELKEMLT